MANGHPSGSRAKKTRVLLRHRVLMRILKFLVSPLLRLIFRYRPERFSVGSKPALLLTNHNSDIDPAFVGIACRDYLRFVASSHITRWRFAGRLLHLVFNPIIRVKGATESRAAMEIIRTLRGGCSVCVFAEGNRSFNGETGAILPSTAKLARRSGSALITYRIHGGYFTTPRWGHSLRRGGMWGEFVREYSPAELALMTDDEVRAAIRNDLFVDAYADQAAANRRYRGKKLAENIEIALYLCPCCHRFETVRSSGDRLFCRCGMEMRYTDAGSLEPGSGTAAPFASVSEWDRWQRSALRELILSCSDTSAPLFSDGRQLLHQIDRGSVSVLPGRMRMFRDRLEFTPSDGETAVFPLGKIDNIDTVARMDLAFFAGGRQYELHSEITRSPVKYRDAFRIITNTANRAV